MEKLHIKLQEINHVIKEENSKENDIGILDGFIWYCTISILLF